jgi:hypothetical protein
MKTLARFTVALALFAASISNEAAALTFSPLPPAKAAAGAVKVRHKTCANRRNCGGCANYYSAAYHTCNCCGGCAAYRYYPVTYPVCNSCNACGLYSYQTPYRCGYGYTGYNCGCCGGNCGCGYSYSGCGYNGHWSFFGFF